MPDTDKPVVTDSPVVPVPADEPEYVADGPIYIDGVRAYNDGDAVTAAAVKKNGLHKQVKKSK